MGTCDCHICKKGARIAEAIASRDTENLILLIKELSNDWVNAEFDNDYYRCIFNGSWPRARSILTRALAKVPPETEEERQERESIVSGDGIQAAK